MKKYFALSVGYKTLLVPADTPELLVVIEKMVVCDSKGYGKDQRYEEDKESEVGLTMVDGAKVVRSESEAFDAVEKANQEAKESASRYWTLYNDFEKYKKQNPQQVVAASIPAYQPATANDPAEQSIGNHLMDALAKIV